MTTKEAVQISEEAPEPPAGAYPSNAKGVLTTMYRAADAYHRHADECPHCRDFRTYDLSRPCTKGLHFIDAVALAGGEVVRECGLKPPDLSLRFRRD